MIKIKEIDGFKYIGADPREESATRVNFRKNLTYMKLMFSDWEKDKDMMVFLEEHIIAIDGLTEILDEGYVKGEYDLNKDIHIVLRQDDDNPNLRGQPVVIISNKKPRNVNKYIKEWKDYFDDYENRPFNPMFGEF